MFKISISKLFGKSRHLNLRITQQQVVPFWAHYLRSLGSWTGKRRLLEGTGGGEMAVDALM
jgi:hypothetical protein